MAANRRVPFYQNHFMTGIGNIQTGLNPGNTATNYQSPFGYRDFDRVKWLVLLYLLDHHLYQIYGFFGGLLTLFMHPGAVFAKVGHLAEVGV